MEGVSLIYSLNDAKAKDRHVTQYFEMFGNAPSIMTAGSRERS